MTLPAPLRADSRERPIIFTGDSVRAILEGRKTQTRRVIKLDRDGLLSRNGYFIELHPTCGPIWHPYSGSGVQAAPKDVVSKFCPYGIPGEKLWVRETWRPGRLKSDPPIYRERAECGMIATNSQLVIWRSPIHMPRSASRITLELTNVRVQRLEEISEEDAQAEGMIGSPLNEKQWYRENFEETWNSVNAKRGYGWDTNAWVWVITFKRIQP